MGAVGVTMNERPVDPSFVPVPGGAYSLPLAQAVQWQHALLAAERKPDSAVALSAQTVLAVHDAVGRAVAAERERCAKLCEQVAAEGTSLGGEDAHALFCADRIRGPSAELTG